MTWDMNVSTDAMTDFSPCVMSPVKAPAACLFPKRRDGASAPFLAGYLTFVNPRGWISYGCSASFGDDSAAVLTAEQAARAPRPVTRRA